MAHISSRKQSLRQQRSFIRAERITTDQVLTTSTPTVIIVNSVIRHDDPQGRFSINTSTGIVTVNESGWCFIAGGILWETVGGGRRIITIKVNALDIVTNEDPDVTGSNSKKHSASTLQYVQATEEVLLEGFHTQGSDLDVDVSPNTHLAVAWLGDGV